jgi:sulfate/thiosulfate transport system substrate-binding protein
LLSWENEAYLALNELGKDKFEVVTPSMSILAEPPVSVVDKIAAKHGTAEVAKAYLEFLYSEQGQEIAAKNYYRPRLASVAAKHAAQFPKLQLFTIDDLFGGWRTAQKKHFDEGGVFDKIYTPGA